MFAAPLSRNLTFQRLAVFGFSILLSSAAFAQDPEDPHKVLFEGLQYRSIGPYRGGRSSTITGLRDDPMTCFFGSCGGGVWKTADGGNTWSNISDGYFGGSIGAVAVSDSDPNVMYVGGGEKTVRGNVSHGFGVWKSVDGGKSWASIGLDDSHHIPRIRIHPQDPETVYVAAMGHLYGPSQQRGVFRSTDGGKNWKRILFSTDEAGAVDLLIDPNNPRVLYASTWKIKRTPYSLESGGEGSGLWKSTDGGDNWTEITRRPGLPKDTVGIIGVAVSPVDSNRVWAIIEASDGGLFRSDDAGENWTRINEERTLRQRAWYYTRVYAGPKNIDEVYVMNVRFWRSRDGGKTFSSIRTPHGDHHDLWIDPDDPKRMAVADDGGGQVSFNGGETWSTYQNQPTAQFYRVTTDDHFPYRIYGAQQDNSTVRIVHRSPGGSIGERDWEPTAGGESGHIAPDPNDNDIVYGGSYGGYLTRRNHRTGESRNIHIWPDNPMGHGAGDNKYRFQWNFPIFFSPNDSKTLYAAANVLFKTENAGQNWTQISPDLTRNSASKLGPSGGPITKDNTSVEYYCTIFCAAESHLEPGLLWVGSDDGLIHISRDGGKNWDNVTPDDFPEWAQVNSLEVHPTKKGALYVAATRYKSDDFRPYLYKTTDYGKSWQLITDGIDRKHFSRVVRADPKQDGLLYAGTEAGMYISFDDGANWKSFQINLPIVPITDLAIKNDDLVVATQGRSFWVLDDLTRIHQWNDEIAAKPIHIFDPRISYRIGGRSFGRSSPSAGQNPPGGAVFNLLVNEMPEKDVSIELEIRDAEESSVATFSSKPDKKLKHRKLSLKPGMNRVVWDMRYPSADQFEGMILWGGGLNGPRAVPGTYAAVVTHGESSQTVEFEIAKDPRSGTTDEEFAAQLQFLLESRDKLSETHKSIGRIRNIRQQINAFKARLGKNEDYEEISGLATELVGKLDAIEQELYQTRLKSPQDPLNYPIKLNNRLSSLISAAATGDFPPTQQAREVRDELFKQIDEQLTRFNALMENELVQFNRVIHDKKVPTIMLDDIEEPETDDDE